MNLQFLRFVCFKTHSAPNAIKSLRNCRSYRYLTYANFSTNNRNIYRKSHMNPQYLSCFGINTNAYREDTENKLLQNVTSNINFNAPARKCHKDAAKTETELVPENLTLLQKFKLMYKQYWYVLIPVHVVTTIGWLGGFYYLSKSGVDIAAILNSLHISESIIDKVKDSKMGHFAISYICYKLVTPMRYMVTLGGTTVSIKYLVKGGYIKPIPTKDQLIQMYETKKADRAKRKQDKYDAENPKE